MTKTEPVVTRWLVYVWEDIEPKTAGPYESDDDRDKAAKAIRTEQNAANETGGIYPLDVVDGVPSIDTYSGGFFEEVDESTPADMTVRCVVTCRDSNGSPTFNPVIVKTTRKAYANGKHYDAAVESSKEEGYTEPGLVYDEKAGPLWLFEQFDWSAADIQTVTIGEDDEDDEDDEDAEEEHRYRNRYECPCGEKWSDESAYTNNDRCPKCNKEIQPSRSDDLNAEDDDDDEELECANCCGTDLEYVNRVANGVLWRCKGCKHETLGPDERSEDEE